VTSPVTVPAQQRFLGVDIGGTGTRIVLADGAGTTLAQASVPTATSGAVEHLLNDLAGMAPAGLDGVGIGASGPIDVNGVIQNPDTLPAYTGVDLAEAVRAQFGVPVVIDSDAVTAALGEARRGAGRAGRNILMLTLGTGVGVAMLREGRPVRTADGRHPEAGHLWLPGGAPCYCGRSSCWEQQASRAALQKTAAERWPGVDLAVLSEDFSAASLFDDYGRAVGIGLADLLTLYGPDLVVIGGGGARYLEVFRPTLEQALAEVRGCYEVPSVVAAELGDVAGAVGAALMAAQLISASTAPA
jgi:glucokinase